MGPQSEFLLADAIKKKNFNHLDWDSGVHIGFMS